jgi:hypothetical protein
MFCLCVYYFTFYRCLAHFPPADTYESMADVDDVSLRLKNYLKKINKLVINERGKTIELYKNWKDNSSCRNFIMFWRTIF